MVARRERASDIIFKNAAVNMQLQNEEAKPRLMSDMSDIFRALDDEDDMQEKEREKINLDEI